MNEEQIFLIGTMLEEKGLSHSEIDEYFEHAGVKGMQWGVRREARKDVNNYKALRQKSTKGIVDQRKEAKAEIKKKSSENEVYAKVAKKEQKRIFTRMQKLKFVAAGAMFIATNPKVRKTLISVARVSGEKYRQMNESKVEKFLRKNASTFVGDFIDVNNGFPALIRGK